MAVHPLTYEYLSSRYTLTSAFPVCSCRAWYEARVHPSAPDPCEPRRRWLEMRFPKRPNHGGVISDRPMHAAGVENNDQRTHPRRPPHRPSPARRNRGGSTPQAELDLNMHWSWNHATDQVWRQLNQAVGDYA
jgi:hypothetical protein